MKTIQAMNIYQGEPLSDSMRFKSGSGYISDLSLYQLEALIRSVSGVVYKTWSSASGTIVKTVVNNIGYATFTMNGAETALMKPGRYTIEVAYVINGSRAIGVAHRCITIKAARLRSGTNL